VTRRSALSSIACQPSTHAGLWLDKFLAVGKESAVQKARLIREASEIAVPQGYRQAFAYRRASFERLADADRALLFTATARGRLVVGLGQKGVLEAGLRIEPTWGVPILPGSSIKGLAAATAHLLVDDPQWRKNLSDEEREKTSFDKLFGTTDEAGAVVFHDAWWIPGDAKTLPIHPDVMTVHHSGYYGGDGSPPSDFDSPTPVPFATVNGDYLVVLEGEPAWCEAAGKLLEHGLAELGAGAKTNAGYGRMKLTEIPSAKQGQRRALEEETARRRKLAAERIGAPPPAPRHLPGQAQDRVRRLLDAERDGVDEGLLRQQGAALHAVNPSWWKTWLKQGKCTDEERAFFERYMKPQGG